jgi:hypothetical protein
MQPNPPHQPNIRGETQKEAMARPLIINGQKIPMGFKHPRELPTNFD